MALTEAELIEIEGRALAFDKLLVSALFSGAGRRELHGVVIEYGVVLHDLLTLTDIARRTLYASTPKTKGYSSS
jgi:hypothetical protein